MESGDIQDKTVFTLLWEITNAGLLDDKDYNTMISTPFFRIRTLERRKFILRFFTKNEFKNQNCVSLVLFLRDAKFNFPIDIEWSFLGSDGKAFSSGILENCRPKGKYGYFSGPKNFFVIEMSGLPTFEEVFQNRRLEFLQHNKLRVRLRIWRSKGVLACNEFIYCWSRTRTKKDFTLWNIPDISRLELDEPLNFPFVLDVTSKAEKFLMTFTLEGMTLDKSYAVIQITSTSQKNPTDPAITIKVSIINSENKIAHCVEGKTKFSGKEPYCFPNLMTRKKLLEENKSILRNDVLSLLCEVSFVEFSSTVLESFYNLNPREHFATFLGSESQTSQQNHDPTAFSAISLQERDSASVSAKNPSTFVDSSSQTSEEMVNFLRIKNSNEIFNSTANLIEEEESMIVLSQDLLNLYSNEILFDFELRCRDDSFRVHKNILSARSSFFRDMFSNMPESASNSMNVFDVDTQTLIHTLEFLYSGLLVISDWKSALKLFSAAHMYQVNSLKVKCRSFFRCNINCNNFYDVLLLSDRHSDSELKTIAHDIIQLYYTEIMKSPQWKRFMTSNIKLAGPTMYHVYLKMPSAAKGNINETEL